MISVFLWWLLPDSNWGHVDLQSTALPTELKSRGNALYIIQANATLCKVLGDDSYRTYYLVFGVFIANQHA